MLSYWWLCFSIFPFLCFELSGPPYTRLQSLTTLVTRHTWKMTGMQHSSRWPLTFGSPHRHISSLCNTRASSHTHCHGSVWCWNNQLINWLVILQKMNQQQFPARQTWNFFLNVHSVFSCETLNNFLIVKHFELHFLYERCYTNKVYYHYLLVLLNFYFFISISFFKKGISLGFGLFVGQNKQFKDVNLSSSFCDIL